MKRPSAVTRHMCIGPECQSAANLYRSALEIDPAITEPSGQCLQRLTQQWNAVWMDNAFALFEASVEPRNIGSEALEAVGSKRDSLDCGRIIRCARRD